MEKGCAGFLNGKLKTHLTSQPKCVGESCASVEEIHGELS